MSSIDVKSANTVEVGYDEFCGALAAHDLQALWSLQRKIMPDTPLPSTQPWLWKWDTIFPLAKRAGEIITIERGGDRRVLALANPGLNGLPFTSTTLWGAIQYLGPGETAPAHRHTPSAIRFVMTGSGVYTTVDGDACEMEPGDLILTPNWMWHDHNNYGEEPMVWFDGLDLPLMVNLESIFFENHPDLQQPVRGHGLSEQLHAGPGLAPAGEERDPLNSPLLRYSWANTERQLEEHARAARRARGDGRVPEHGHRRPGDPHVRVRDDAALARRAHADAARDRQLRARRLPGLRPLGDRRHRLRVGPGRHLRRAVVGGGRPRGVRAGRPLRAQRPARARGVPALQARGAAGAQAVGESSSRDERTGRRGKARVEWDPYAPEAIADPPASWAELREHCPVAWSERMGGFWAVSRYDDVVSIARASDRFNNSGGPQFGTSRPPLEVDRPEHTFFRRVLQPHFARERVAQLEPGVRGFVAEMLAPAARRR